MANAPAAASGKIGTSTKTQEDKEIEQMLADLKA